MWTETKNFILDNIIWFIIALLVLVALLLFAYVKVKKQVKDAKAISNSCRKIAIETRSKQEIDNLSNVDKNNALEVDLAHKIEKVINYIKVYTDEILDILEKSPNLKVKNKAREVRKHYADIDIIANQIGVDVNKNPQEYIKKNIPQEIASEQQNKTFKIKIKK